MTKIQVRQYHGLIPAEHHTAQPVEPYLNHPCFSTTRKLAISRSRLATQRFDEFHNVPRPWTEVEILRALNRRNVQD